MARTTAQIQAQILSNLQTNYGQVGQPFYYYFNDLNANPITPSMTSRLGLIIFIISAAINIFETINDQFLSDVETQVASASVLNAQWIQKLLLYFQYSATNPQFISVAVSATYPFVTLAYAVINNALNIITQAAVVTLSNRSVLIKVASNSTPLTSPQITALTSYLQNIIPPGTQWAILSVLPDQIFVQAQVYVDGAYMGVIQANMDAAINNFLAAIPFNGTFEVSDLLKAMKAVAGVKDVILNNVQARQYNQSFGTGTNLVLANDWVQRLWATYAGYAISETTAGETLNDQITYIAA